MPFTCQSGCDASQPLPDVSEAGKFTYASANRSSSNSSRNNAKNAQSGTSVIKSNHDVALLQNLSFRLCAPPPGMQITPLPSDPSVTPIIQEACAKIMIFHSHVSFCLSEPLITRVLSR